MRPVPIPEPYRTVLALAGGKFQLFGAPAGHDDEVPPTEACTYRTGVVANDGEVHREDQVVTALVIELDDHDIELLTQSRMFEFGVWGTSLPVFFMHPLRTIEAEEVDAIMGSREGGSGGG